MYSWCCISSESFKDSCHIEGSCIMGFLKRGIQRENALGERPRNENKVVTERMRATLDLQAECNKNSLFLHYLN